ncbi:unnamed protein product, partial [Prorocentrum cordatum]
MDGEALDGGPWLYLCVNVAPMGWKRGPSTLRGGSTSARWTWRLDWAPNGELWMFGRPPRVREGAAHVDNVLVEGLGQAEATRLRRVARRAPQAAGRAARGDS